MLITTVNGKRMKLKNVILGIILLKILFHGQDLNAQNRIVIDVGHGGKDPGAIGIGGILEKDIVQVIAGEIIELNHEIFEGKYEIFLTRYSDTLVSLEDRGRLGKTLKADLFLSLHCNASENDAKGMEVYALTPLNNKNGRKSVALGLAVLSESSRNLKLHSRGIKFSDFQILRQASAYCPAILIETGFVTNRDEARYFLNPANLKALALAILIGINNYLQSI